MRNLAAIDSETRAFRITSSERAIFRYGLAVLSVALALGIKLLLLRLNFPYPLSTSFLAAIAITFGMREQDPAFLLSCFHRWRSAISYSRIKLTIVWFFRTDTTKPVYLPTVGVSHLLYLVYFGLVALLMGWFSASRRQAERLLKQARSELEAKVEERTAKLSRLNDDLLERDLRTRVGGRPAPTDGAASA